MIDKNILKSLAEGVAEDLPTKKLLAQLDEKLLQSEAEELASNPEWIPEVLKALFGECIPTDQSFYDKVVKFARPFGFGDPSEKLIATIWLVAVNELNGQQRTNLVDHLLDTENNNFWRMLGAFPFFLPEAHLPPAFLASYFSRMGEKIGADWGGGPFFRAVELFSTQIPSEAHQVLKVFYAYKEPSEMSVHVASILLGGVRAASRNSKFDSRVFDETEKSLMTSISLRKRVYYYRSWSTSFTLGAVSLDELSNKLDDMLSGLNEEQDEAFKVIDACARAKREDESLASFAFGWLSEHSSLARSSLAKYVAVDAVWMLFVPSPKKARVDHYESVKRILGKVQPIPSKDLGTWHQLEYILVEILHWDKDKFVELLATLFEANPGAFITLFDEDGLEYIESEIRQAKIDDRIFTLLFSEDDFSRKLGFILFKSLQLGFNGLTPQTGLSPSSEILRKMLLDFVNDLMLGGSTSSFLLLMLPYAEKSDNEFKNEFKSEMLLQAVNYPGACLENWKSLKIKSDLLDEVIKSADAYFERLRQVNESPANSFSFSQLAEASEHRRREQSRDLNEQVKQKSVIMNLVSVVNVIYGETWGSFIEGALQKPTGFHGISHSQEYPRLEEIDPEWMEIRRLEARMKILSPARKEGPIE